MELRPPGICLVVCLDAFGGIFLGDGRDDGRIESATEQDTVGDVGHQLALYGGFKCVVALPKGTNTDIEKRVPKTEEDKMLFARNKWLLMHPEAAEEGQYVGLVGENICV